MKRPSLESISISSELLSIDATTKLSSQHLHPILLGDHGFLLSRCRIRPQNHYQALDAGCGLRILFEATLSPYHGRVIHDVCLVVNPPWLPCHDTTSNVWTAMGWQANFGWRIWRSVIHLSHPSPFLRRRKVSGEGFTVVGIYTDEATSS